MASPGPRDRGTEGRVTASSRDLEFRARRAAQVARANANRRQVAALLVPPTVEDDVALKVLLRKDLLNVVPSSAGVEIEITMDADGGLRFYAVGGGGGGVTDHGALTGLSDDDHAQYVLANGSRAFTGVVVGVDPTIPSHLATAAYVNYADGVLQSTILAIAVAAFQPLNANLSGLASLPPNADKLPYFTTSGGAMAVTTLTAAARSVIAQTTYADIFTLVAPDPGGSEGLITSVGGVWSFADLHGAPDGALIVVDSANNGANWLVPGALCVLNSVATANIDADAVTFAKMQNLTTDRLVGRDTAGTGDPEQLTVGGGVEFTGSGGIQRSALTGDVTATAGSNATTIASAAVTLAKMANIATDTLIGRDTAGTGVPEAIAVSGGVEFSGSGGIRRSALTGDVTATAGSNATTIANDAVTNAKLSNMANNTVKCRVTAGTGDPEDASFVNFCLAAKIPFAIASEAGDPVRTVGASSTAEATLSSLTLTKGMIRTTGFAVLEIYGDLLQNWAGTNHGTMRIKVGSTTVYAKQLDCAQDPDIRPWCIRVVVASRGATNKQRVTAVIGIGAAFTPGTGHGDYGTWAGPTHTLYGDSAEDAAASNLDIAVTNQWDTSDASSYFRIYHAKLTVFP